MALPPPSSAPSFASEGELVALCRRGDRAAMNAVFRREGPFLLRFIRRILGPHPDAEDVLSVTLTRAVSAFPRYRGEAPVGQWLHGIAVRVAQDELRKKARSRRLALALVQEMPAATSASPEGVVDARRKLERLYQLLEALPAKRRVAFILHALEGYSLEEVGAMVGASSVTLRSRLFWARRSLVNQAQREPLLKELFETGVAR